MDEPMEWHPMMVYNAGDRVVKNGVIYLCNWWTSNDPEFWNGPDGSGKPWTVEGSVQPRPDSDLIPLPPQITPPIVAPGVGGSIPTDTVVATRRAIMPRIQSIVIPILRDWPALEGVEIRSWGDNIDYREFPYINVRRIAGAGTGRDWVYPNKLDIGVLEMTAYSAEGLIECEHIYNIALEALYDAVHTQKQTDTGYLHSIREAMGMTQFSSKFMDSWRVQGLVKLGFRPKTNLS